MDSIQAGVVSAIMTYREGAIAPINLLAAAERLDWDSWQARQFRYLLSDLYYHNMIFSSLENFRQQHIKTRGLYKYTRGIYNPVFRLVFLTGAKCYGGTLDWNDLSNGAVPITGADDQVLLAVRQLWQWSNFQATKTRYARSAVRYGDGFIKLVDDPGRQKVRMEFLHPGLVADAEIDAVGFVKSARIEYQDIDADTKKPYIYTEIITKDSFETFKDGEPFAYYDDENGRPVPGWDNPYGFVPLVHVKPIDNDRKWGSSTFSDTLAKIDEANSLGALIHDQVRKTVNAMFYAPGVQSVRQVTQTNTGTNDDEFTGEEREEIDIMTGPEGSTIVPVVANLPIDQALAVLREQLDEIEKDLPELSLHRLREFAQHSAPAVQMVMTDAVDRLTEISGNLDQGLVRSFQMAITMGGVNHYKNFERFGLEDYERGNLELQIAERPILNDQLSKKERIDTMISADAPKRWIWQELDKDEQDIAEAELNAIEQDTRVAAEVARTLAGLGGNNDQP